MDSQRYAGLLSTPLDEARIAEKRLLALRWFPTPEGVCGSALPKYVIAIPMEPGGFEPAASVFRLASQHRMEQCRRRAGGRWLREGLSPIGDPCALHHLTSQG